MAKEPDLKSGEAERCLGSSPSPSAKMIQVKARQKLTCFNLIIKLILKDRCPGYWKKGGVRMIELRGEYNTAKVFTDKIDSKAISQITELCNQQFTAGSKIRIMPDTHAGVGCTIGTTMTIKDKIVPNLVGVDIGCGMETVRLKPKGIDLEKLDRVIYSAIPSGFAVRKKEHSYTSKIDFNRLHCRKSINIDRARYSIGTLGGGNHFIEVGKDHQENLYLVVHSGSRHLGKQVAEYYQQMAYQELINRKGRTSKALQSLKINKSLAYLQGESFNRYIHDMEIVQLYAFYNRKAIIEEILNRFALTSEEQFTTIHNYLDLEQMILRKGAISAQKGERVLIPINMRDGSLLCTGKGNPDWNYSAPHGAGRLMSRRKAKATVKLKEYQKTMAGIYTTSVNRTTIDEAPMVYKPLDEIVKNMQAAVKVELIIKPIYNFKAGS